MYEYTTVNGGGNPTNASLTITKPCRVLVVDDDSLVRSRLCMLLNAAQYQVEVASNGEEALRIMNTVDCHVVLTDWQMPDMDGLALCRRVRLQMHDRYVYVLMLTIRDTDGDVLTGLAAGADSYVVKGAPIDEILAHLEIGRRISQSKYLSPTQKRDMDSSSRDPVTGAHGLNYFMEKLPCEWARSQRYGHSLAVLTCHIDGFNGFSDRFGREAGEEQLRAFVSSARASIRKSDWLSRTICDSFMIVLPETPAMGAHRAAQKLRALFAVHPLSTPTDPVGFTVTVEVASVDGKRNAHGAAQIHALLRTATCGEHGRVSAMSNHAAMI
jgi:two-component system, cell cycle response regulator